ncbi:MAG: hydroxyacylglutathione hydrolase [Desulfobacterales bacterium]|nr:hydroxyacylglutathione hydrolase [Desulfobacterales bacterium]
MNIKQFRYSADNLGYVVYGNKSAMAIDGGAVSNILSFINQSNLELKYVANTHTHLDHTVGNQSLLKQTDAEFLDISTLLKKETVEIDGEKIGTLHTPGHTPDSICFYFDNILVSGDTIFNGKIGRCFTGDIKAFYKAIKTIMAFPENTIIYAGHDYVEEYIEFARSLDPDNEHLDPYLQAYDPDHVFATLEDEMRVDPFLRFNDEKIISILKKRDLPVKTEYDRWKSMLSLM